MSLNFGFLKQNDTSFVQEEISKLETKIQANKTADETLKTKIKNNKTAIINIATFVYQNYKTVFEINVKTASKDMPGLPGLQVRSLQQDGSILTQKSSWNYPVVGLDYVKNDSFNFMHFLCHEFMFTNVNVFIVLEALTTAVSGDWCYIFGNDNGSYDKFLGYKANSLNQLSWGGSYPVKHNNCTLPSGFDIKTKHLLSIHWLMLDSCLYANGAKISGSEFTSNYKSTGDPYGSVFYNDRLPSGSSAAKNIFTGKIYGIKIMTGPMSDRYIREEHQKLITEYNITV